MGEGAAFITLLFVSRRSCVIWFGTWNVKGINGIIKREEVVDVFRKRKSGLLAFTETNFKGSGDISWCGVKGIFKSVQEIGMVRKF